MKQQIVLEDFTINDPKENYDTTGWGYICKKCMKAFNINAKHLDIGGCSGYTLCSVKNCQNEAEAYLDIPNSIPAPAKNKMTWTIPTQVLQ